MLPARLPARRIWNPPSRALVKRYDMIEEPVAATSVYQRLRRPIVLWASVLVVTSTVYLGFIHRNDSRVGTPIGVSGKVQTQNDKPSTVVVQKPAPVVAQRPPNVVTQRPPSIVAQQQPNAVTQRPAPVRSPPIAPPAASPPAPRRVASGQPASPADKLREDLSRHLRAARAKLQENNLTATKTRLAAAIAAQPDSREAQRMRSTVSTREQQRDALLSLARGCGYIGRWTCVHRNASTALEIDSSSKEAQRLVTLATRETELQIPPPVETPPDPSPELREATTHH